MFVQMAQLLHQHIRGKVFDGAIALPDVVVDDLIAAMVGQSVVLHHIG